MVKIRKVKNEDYSLLNNHTGELEDFYQSKKVSIDEFIMVFFSSYPEIFKLRGVTLKVLMCCWKHSSYKISSEMEGNIMNNNTVFKEYCRSQGLVTSDANIDNAVSELAKKEFLIKRCRGEYMLNPKYFFKGSLSSRSKLAFQVYVDPLAKE